MYKNIQRSLLTIFFTVFYLVFWHKYQGQFVPFVKWLNGVYACKAMYTLAKTNFKKIKPRTIKGRLWQYFQIVRNYYLLQILWGLVYQSINLIIDRKFRINRLNIKHAFSDRMKYIFWLDLLAAVVLENLPYSKYLSLILLNMANFPKVHKGLKNYSLFKSSLGKNFLSKTGKKLLKETKLSLILRQHLIRFIGNG